MEEQVRAILAETLETTPDEITPDKRFVADLGLTSFDLADVVVQAREEFGVTIPSERWTEIVTVADIYRVIREEMGS